MDFNSVTSMLIGSWFDLVRVLVVGTLAYFSLILLLRISGKRTLSKLNAFDLVITVSLGSTLASAFLSKEVSLSEAVVAFSLLIVLQFIMAWSSVNVKLIRNLIKSEPALLFYQGEYLHNQLKSERVLVEEIRAVAREQGALDMSQVEAVVLETAGDFSVIKRQNQAVKASALEDVNSKGRTST